MSRGISGGKQVICLFPQNETTIIVCKMFSSSFDKFYVSIACCEDIYNPNCMQKRNNDHLIHKLPLSSLR